MVTRESVTGGERLARTGNTMVAVTGDLSSILTTVARLSGGGI
jgi:hypothetical protein